MSESEAIVRFLPLEERWKLANDYGSEPLPDARAVVLVVEKDSEIVAHMALHGTVTLGLTHVAPKWRSNGALAVKMLAHAAEQMFSAGDSLFVPVADNESKALVENMGCYRIGELYRKDF
jgi:hypothetical protein